MADQNQIFKLNYESVQHFFNFFCIRLVLVRRKFYGFFFKISKMAALTEVFIPAARHLGFFASLPNQMNAKRRLKKHCYVRKSDFDPPFWIQSQFLTNLTNYGHMDMIKTYC
jgi:hypothetical protein